MNGDDKCPECGHIRWRHRKEHCDEQITPEGFGNFVDCACRHWQRQDCSWNEPWMLWRAIARSTHPPDHPLSDNCFSCGMMEKLDRIFPPPAAVAIRDDRVEEEA